MIFSVKLRVFLGFALSLFLLWGSGVLAQELLQTQPQKDVDESEVQIPLDVDPTAVTSFNQLALTYPTSDIPVILPRSIWENDEKLVKLLMWLPEADHEPPDYYPISRIIVHDLGCPLTSTTCNSDTVDPRKMIQSIYRFHSVTRGWGDIGYNYIIDRQGRVYEGRYGGNSVRAAHLYYDSQCDNFNPGSAGILLLGRYETTSAMPEPMQKSLARLTAWLSLTNGLNLESSNVPSEIWHNPKTNSVCDITQGSFTSSFMGPVLLSHGDIEKGNSDKFDLSEIRANAIALLEFSPAYVFNTGQDLAKRYTIANGFREEFTETSSSSSEETSPTSTAESTAPASPVSPRLITINKNQLYAFVPKSPSLFAEGALLKSDTRDRIYVVEKGKRRLIASKTIFDKYGFDWKKVVIVTDRELAGSPLGLPLTFPEGSLLAEDNGDVYVVEKDTARHITSAALFASLNFSWKSIIPVTKEEIKVHKISDPLLFPEGTLIKGPEPRVYVIEDKKRRPIGSLELFNTLKFKWNAIKTFERFELDRYPLGKFALWPTGTLIRAPESPKVYLVEESKKRWITSAEEFASRGYQWKDVVSIAKTELDDYPSGDVIGVIIEEEIPSETPASIPITSPESDTAPSEETPTLSKGPLIRIGIYSFSSGSNFGIRANKPYGVYTAEGLKISHEANEATTLVIEKTSEFYRFASADPDVIFEILSYEDRPSWNQSLNDNLFRGAIEVKYSTISGKFWAINELPVEDYIKGVSEAGNSDALEHLKVFTVASRSYASYHLARGGKRQGEPFHLLNTPNDQVYKGYGYEKRAPNWVSVVSATNGEIATYNGDVIVAAYSSGAPGPTLSACSLWGGKFCDSAYDYLDGGVGDPEGTVYAYAGCGGAVHCVGIDAAGSRRFAALGKVYSEILKYYYPGTELKKSY